MPSGQMARCWAVQLGQMSNLAVDSRLDQSKWGDCHPSVMLHPDGKFQAVDLKHLTASHKLGGSVWIGQFSSYPRPSARFRIASYSRRAIGSEIVILLRNSYKPLPDRLRGRPSEPGFNGAQKLAGGELGEVKKRRILPPIPLASDWKPIRWRPIIYNVSFRFGFLQSDKLRACDDLERSIANIAWSAPTPIQPASWYLLARLSQLMATYGAGWALFKAVREEAYKNLPIDPRGQREAIVSLRRPFSR